MRNRIAHYLELRRVRLSRATAARMSGIDRYAGRLLHLSGWIVCGLTVWLILSGSASAINEAADNRVAAKVTRQAGEIEELRKIVAACLSDETGKPLKIGDDWFLCGISHVGSWQ